MARMRSTRELVIVAALALACTQPVGDGGDDDVGADAPEGAVPVVPPLSGEGGDVFPTPDASIAPPTPDAGAGEDPALTACRNLAPAPSAEETTVAIQGCLDRFGLASLGPGVYPITRGLTIPASALLEGRGDPRPLVQLQPGTGFGGNYVVTFTAASPPSAKARVRHLRIDAHDALGLYANAAIVHFGVDNAVVEDAELFNETMPVAGHGMAGAYFICDTCTGNELRASQLHGSFYGVIFRGRDAGAQNVAAGNELYDLKCDGFTFSGYGIADGNLIHDVGYDCENGPIPGAGAYTLVNAAGGVMRANRIWNTCGHGLDLDRGASFLIEDNVVSSPGYPFGGYAPWCGWAAGALFHGLRDTTIRRNTIVNDGGARNRVGAGGYDIYAAFGRAAFTDLPAGAATVIGAIFSEPRITEGWEARNDVVENNQFRASCADGEGCTGLGLFTSRSTGYDGTDWSAATTNYFTGNASFGSDVGSVRCGGDWFAGSSDCPPGAPAPCNDDDHQHPGTFHSDGCSFF